MSQAAAGEGDQDRAAYQELQCEQAVQRRVGPGERDRLGEHVAVVRKSGLLKQTLQEQTVTNASGARHRRVDRRAARRRWRARRRKTRRPDETGSYR